MIVKLQGGLGNQMFQAAYGLTEARKRKEELYFDTSLLGVGEPRRTYELGPYLPYAKFKDDPAAEEGYWQSEKYFDRELILDTFNRPHGPKPEEVKKHSLDCIREGTTFIGVRRADYLRPDRLAFHGVMPVEYYDEAIALLKPTRMVCFSDDPGWAWEHLGLRSIRTVPAWDIWLMSLCENAIIANSSFHWWGAFLGMGKVVAPKKWFATKVPGAEDIVPKRWITI